MQSRTEPVTEKDLFLKELRAVTSPAHKNLESTALSKAIISDKLSLEDYAMYLSKMQSVIEACEKEVFPFVKPFISDLEQRYKSDLIKKDLKFISEKTKASPVNTFRGFGDQLSAAYAMGCMYVIEGSTLGGKFIYKNVNATLLLDAENGASYFNGYGAEIGKLWSSFMDQFCDYAINSKEQAEIIRGADETFSFMFDHLNS